MALNPRTAREVIDQAIAENKAGERLLYVFASTFIGLGVLLIIWGVVRGDKGFALVGTLASTLFWPAMNQARQTRKESIAIRLLEAPLARADTGEKAAEMLHGLFLMIMVEKENKGEQVSRKVGEKRRVKAGGQ